MILDIVFMPSP
ncbi:hypothetical protein LINPERHAP2_LOCUS14246 [Linum perenne]